MYTVEIIDSVEKLDDLIEVGILKRGIVVGPNKNRVIWTVNGNNQKARIFI